MKDNALPKIKQADEQILVQAARTLMAIMEQRDPQLNLHCGRVANNCANFCESHLSARPPEVAAMYLAGVLHDIGMIFLPLNILQKTEALAEDENALAREHPVTGENILAHLTALKACMKPKEFIFAT